jgi:hypothetical protein
MNFERGKLYYWKVREWDYSGSFTGNWEYKLVQFFGEQELPPMAVKSSDPEDWAYVVWDVENASSRIQPLIVKGKDLYDREFIDSEFFKALE